VLLVDLLLGVLAGHVEPDRRRLRPGLVDGGAEGVEVEPAETAFGEDAGEPEQLDQQPRTDTKPR